MAQIGVTHYEDKEARSQGMQAVLEAEKVKVTDCLLTLPVGM